MPLDLFDEAGYTPPTLPERFHWNSRRSTPFAHRRRTIDVLTHALTDGALVLVDSRSLSDPWTTAELASTCAALRSSAELTAEVQHRLTSFETGPYDVAIGSSHTVHILRPISDLRPVVRLVTWLDLGLQQRHSSRIAATVHYAPRQRSKGSWNPRHGLDLRVSRRYRTFGGHRDSTVREDTVRSGEVTDVVDLIATELAREIARLKEP